MRKLKRIIKRLYIMYLNNIVYYSKSIKYKFLNLFNYKNKLNGNEKRETKIIVSITSIPSRFQGLSLCIESIMRQTMRPDKIILYLGNNVKDIELPQKLKKLQERGLTIEYREDKDLKPHTKYFYAMQEFPNDIIITMDDDILYNKNVIRCLYKSYLKYPNSISAIRVHKIKFDSDGKFQKYNNWQMEFTGKDAMIPNHFLCATGVGGVLYPPNIMPKETFNKENIKEMAVANDDLWLKIMEIKADIAVVKAIKRNYYLFIIKNTQTIALNKKNVELCENDIIMNKLVEFYKINKNDLKR